MSVAGSILKRMENLLDEHIPLIQKALEVCASNELIDEHERKTGGIMWNKAALLSFRDYAKEKGRNTWKS